MKAHYIFQAPNQHDVLIDLEANRLAIVDGQEKMVFDTADSQYPTFVNAESGERVIELSGMATDQRSDRSWAIAEFEQDGYTPRHFHQAREEWYYFVSGQGKVTVDGVEKIYHPGEFLNINRGQKHQVLSIDPTVALKMIVKCAPAWIFSDQHSAP